jgi:hypothetical protein
MTRYGAWHGSKGQGRARVVYHNLPRSSLKKRSSSSNSSSNYIPALALLALLLGSYISFIITYLGVLIIYGGWLYFEYNTWGSLVLAQEPNSENTDQEAKQIKILFCEKQKLENKLSELKESGADVRRNKNGKYDERSDVGRRLNIEIPNVMNALDGVDELASQLIEAPKQRVNEWVNLRGYQLAIRFTGIIFPILALYLYIYKQKELNDAMFDSVFVSLLIFFTIKLFFHFSAGSKFKDD